MVTQTEFLLAYFILAVICGLILLGAWFVKTYVIPEEVFYSQYESMLELNEDHTDSSDNSEDKAAENNTTINAHDESVVVVNPVIIISGDSTSSDVVSSFKSLKPDESQKDSDNQQETSDD